MKAGLAPQLASPDCSSDISQSISLHEQQTELLNHPKSLGRGNNE
jgi:hypothetical protein